MLCYGEQHSIFVWQTVFMVAIRIQYWNLFLFSGILQSIRMYGIDITIIVRIQPKAKFILSCLAIIAHQYLSFSLLLTLPCLPCCVPSIRNGNIQIKASHKILCDFFLWLLLLLSWSKLQAAFYFHSLSNYFTPIITLNWFESCSMCKWKETIWH